MVAPVIVAGGVKVVAAIASAIATLFGIFGGGVSAAVKRALEGIRAALAQTAEWLMRFAHAIARFAGKILTALHNAWIRVIRPMLERLQRQMARLGRLLDRVLRPYLEFMAKVREQIMLIYQRYFYPVLVMIQQMRQMLALLKMLHVPGAKQLDARLARLEAKVMAPITELLKRTATLPGWFNTILTASYSLQYPLFANSMAAYEGELVRRFYHAQSKDVTAAERAAWALERPEVTPAMAAAQVRDYLTTGGGPLAVPTNEALARLRAALGG